VSSIGHRRDPGPDRATKWVVHRAVDPLLYVHL